MHVYEKKNMTTINIRGLLVDIVGNVVKVRLNQEEI